MKRKRVMVIDAMTIWNARKPKFNGYMCGHGVHGSRKYDRNVMKRQPIEY